MARPKKNTVDYFPHDCYWSKELEIFVNKYGNDGYAFYYRLFEQLGVSPNHKYECGEPVDKQYLASKTGVTEEKMNQYIGDLVSVGVIDESYWKEGIVWAQSFVDSVAEVYKKRATALPTKESFRPENSMSTGFPTRKQGFTQENGSFRVGNSQSKVNNTKKEESVVEESTTHTDIPNWVNEIGNQYPKVDVKYSFERYKNFCEGKNKSVTESSFKSWVMDDDRKDMNLKKKEKPTHTTLYCVNCNSPMQVSVNKNYGHLCEKCNGQMVSKHELAAFRRPITKAGK